MQLDIESMILTKEINNNLKCMHLKNIVIEIFNTETELKYCFIISSVFLCMLHNLISAKFIRFLKNLEKNLKSQTRLEKKNILVYK